jgi:hypothetical protein
LYHLAFQCGLALAGTARTGTGREGEPGWPAEDKAQGHGPSDMRAAEPCVLQAIKYDMIGASATMP